MLCKTCGGYRAGPCDDCVDGECTMNCGPAMIDVRAIFDAADAEFAAAGKHALTSADEGRAMRDAVRGMMVRLGLYGLWDRGEAAPAHRHSDDVIEAARCLRDALMCDSPFGASEVGEDWFCRTYPDVATMTDQTTEEEET